MNKNEAISYLFKDCRNKVKDTKTGIIWYGVNYSAISNVVLPMEVYNSFPDSIFEIVT